MKKCQESINPIIFRNVLLIAITAIFVIGSNLVSHAEQSWQPKSHGRIVYDNGTSDTSDDVIFDAQDFVKLYNICK